MPNPIDLRQELLSLVRAQQVTSNSGGGLQIAGLTSGTPEPASNAPVASVPTAGDSVTQLSQELEALRRQLGVAEDTAKRQADYLDQNTRAVLEGNSRLGATAASVARDTLSAAQGTGVGSLLTSPIAGLVNWLFRRGNSSDSEAVLPAATLPPPIDGTLGISSSSGISPVTYGGDGLPRTTPGTAPTPSAANITIQVNAMDSRSFLDNSDQIARAVREAMLNSHSLNDVLGDM